MLSLQRQNMHFYAVVATSASQAARMASWPVFKLERLLTLKHRFLSS